MLRADVTSGCLHAVVDTGIDTPFRGQLPAIDGLTARNESGDSRRRDCQCLRAHHEHGSRGAYNRDGCRCALCCRANASAARRHRRRCAEQAWNGTTAWVPALGTRRRLQALAAAGWSAAQLATRAGVTRGAIASLRSTRQQRVLATTAAVVSALYDDCWWRTPPGRGRDLARTETWAARRGWADPSRWVGQDIDDPDVGPVELSADVDPVAVAEAIAGRPVQLTRAEQRAISAELTRRGASADEIAHTIGRCARTVLRYRDRDRAIGSAA